MSELSAQSGIPVATIKYYLREGLLPAGRATSATRSVYEEAHLRRLRLVRALIEIGGLSVATTREVLDEAGDTAQPLFRRLGAAIPALSTPSSPPSEDEALDAARGRVDALLEQLGWQVGSEGDEVDANCRPVRDQAARGLAAMARLGEPASEADLLRYAKAAKEIAESDVSAIEDPDPERSVHRAIVWTVLYEPVLLALRRLAHTDAAMRRLVPADAEPRQST